MSTAQGRRAAGILLAAAALHPGPLTAQPAAPAIEQAVVGGEVASPEDFQRVLVVCNGAPVTARAGLGLAPGCIVESGPTQVVTTINRNEVEVIAEPGTQLDFLPDGIRVVVGQVFVKLRAVDIRGWFRVETLHGTAAVRSTQFDVQVTRGRAVFRLLEGALRVSAFDSPEQADIVPGQRAEIQGRRVVRTAQMSREEIRSIVRRVRSTERVLQRAATAGGSYVGLQVPDLAAPAAPVIDTFSADGSLLVWRTRDAARVEITGLGRVPASGSQRVGPAATTTYTLIATGADGRSVTRRATVEVASAPVIDTFSADGNLLVWRTRDAARVEITGLGRVPASGSQRVGPAATTTYTLIATGEDGRSVTRRATVEVTSAPVIDEFRWTGKELRWSVRNAMRVSISGLRTVPLVGSRAVEPGSYTLTAWAADGQRQSKTVTVPAPVMVEPPTINTEGLRRGGIINRLPGGSVE